jgi:hypothetical protein
MRLAILIGLLLLVYSKGWASFAYKASITVNHAYVPNTDQTDLPIAVIGTYDGTAGAPNLKTTGNSGHVQNANGYDIQFFSDSSLTTRIPAERESYNAATGAVVFWVKKTVLTGSDVTIYMAYGDSGISTDPNSDGTYGATSVWDSNYKGVWHLPNGTALSANDSTSGSHNATTNTMTAGAGLIDGGAVNNGTQKIVTDTISGTRSVAHLTVSVWVKPSAVTNLDTFMADCGSGVADVNKQTFDILESGDVLSGSSSRDVLLAVYGSAVDTYGYTTVGNLLTNGSWAYVTMVFDGTLTGDSNRLKGYVNGNSVSMTYSATISATTQSNSAETIIGYGISNTRNFHGTLDEARIATASRSADWILAEYNNQSSPSTFYTMGSETANGGGAYVPLNRGLSIQGGRTKIIGSRVKIQ